MIFSNLSTIIDFQTSDIFVLSFPFFFIRHQPLSVLTFKFPQMSDGDSESSTGNSSSNGSSRNGSSSEDSNNTSNNTSNSDEQGEIEDDVFSSDLSSDNSLGKPSTPSR